MSEDTKERPSCRYEDSGLAEADCNSMSLWTKAQQLQGDALQQVRAVYGEHFPIEVRHFLAAWIEEKMWTDIDPENPQHEQYVGGLVTSLIQELETKAQTMTTEDLFLTKLKLMEAANMFRIGKLLARVLGGWLLSKDNSGIRKKINAPKSFDTNAERHKGKKKKKF